MAELSIGQVVLASFPFSNLTSLKLRPCLVVGLAEFGDVTLCQITSQRYSSRRAIPLANRHFREGSIITNSFIWPDKIATIDRALVPRILGSLADSKLDDVKKALKRYFEIN